MNKYNKVSPLIASEKNDFSFSEAINSQELTIVKDTKAWWTLFHQKFVHSFRWIIILFTISVTVFACYSIKNI